MFDSFLAELLILGMCCLVCLRFFFTKSARVDALTIMAPLSFCFALLAVYNWGAEVHLVAALLVSLLVFLTNVPALFRLSARLYVDHYSVVFVVGSALELVMAVALIIVAVILRPVRYRPTDFGVMRTVESLTGTLASGYHSRSTLFEKSRITGVLYTYEPEPPHEETLTEQRAKANAARKAALAAAAETATEAAERDAAVIDDDTATEDSDTAIDDNTDATAQSSTMTVSTIADSASQTSAPSPVAAVTDVTSASAGDATPEFADATNAADNAVPASKLDAPLAVDDSLAARAAANPVILFMPKSAAANVVQYEPYCIMLAQKGYRVLTAEFRTGVPPLYGNGADLRIFRRAYGVLLSLFAKERFAALQAAEDELAARSYGALTTLALAKYGDDTQLFYAVDAIDIELLDSLTALHPQNVVGFFSIDRVDEFKTSGYGFIEQTDPLLALAFDLARDDTFFIPRYVANRTVRAVQDTLMLLQPVEIIRAHHDDEEMSPHSADDAHQ